MKKLSIIVSVLFIATFSAIPAFPLSYEIDVGQNGSFETGGSINLGVSESVTIDLYLDEYSCTPSDQLFGIQTYITFDPSKATISGFPYDNAHGGPFDATLSGFNLQLGQTNVYQIIASNFNYVTVAGNRQKFGTVTLTGTAEGQFTLAVADDQTAYGYPAFSDGYIADCTLSFMYPSAAPLTIRVGQGGGTTIFPEVATACPEVTTECPVAATSCPVATTECPVQTTVCPAGATFCPLIATSCPEETTECPIAATECPAVATECPAVATECPADPTVCVVTECPQAATSCPAVTTECPVETTVCPVTETTCPIGETFCPVTETVCPADVCPLAYKFDFDGDRYWDTEWELTPPLPPAAGETVQVDIWLNGYVCPPDDNLLGVQLYFSYDPDAMQVIQANPNTTDQGGPFVPGQSSFMMKAPGVYQLLAANSDFVPVIGSRILLGTIELQRIGAGSNIAIEAADDLGIDPYTNGFLKDCESGSLYPIEATATIYQPCSADVDCDDNNLCTEEYCDEVTGRCVFRVLADGSSCDNGIFCDGTETCAGGACLNGTPVDCPGDGLFCTGTESCDEDADQCVSSGNPCGDGQFCNDETDTCAAIEALEPPSAYQARWVPLFRQLSIVGSNTNFEARVSKITFEPKNTAFSFFPRVADKENIAVWTYIMPQVLTGLLADPVKVTVTTGSEVVSAGWVIELLPFIESQ
jgi:hypothetical protein